MEKPSMTEQRLVVEVRVCSVDAVYGYYSVLPNIWK